MVTPSAGAVVVVPFPFSNLTLAKPRPAVVLADAGRGDLILCQVTSNPYADPRAVELTEISFAQGSLRITSYARPGKLFTASRELILSQAGVLTAVAFQVIIESVIHILRTGHSDDLH
ncbi:MAG: MazF family transcriptional regulator [Syntrophobacteraceae bacterium CG07_land_8_20_14_0_80_61_8]|nr:MAG: MazF family transcriptional regulator [Syntrophobacteraceae bacterium CG07_land_8_20_14_0_80_61_8]